MYRVYFEESNVRWLDIEASDEEEAEQLASDDIDSIEWANDSRHEIKSDSIEEIGGENDEE